LCVTPGTGRINGVSLSHPSSLMAPVEKEMRFLSASKSCIQGVGARPGKILRVLRACMRLACEPSNTAFAMIGSRNNVKEDEWLHWDRVSVKYSGI
jgi:hypothetical protein